jgi:hypothetical protein
LQSFLNSKREQPVLDTAQFFDQLVVARSRRRYERPQSWAEFLKLVIGPRAVTDLASVFFIEERQAFP